MKKYIAIIFSVSIVFCQSEDLVDDRLSWLLTNPDNIDELDEDKSKIIKSELSKILEKFNNEVKEKNIFTPTSVKEVVSTSSTFDEDEYYRLRKEGMDEFIAEMYATKITNYTSDAIKRKGFNLKVELSTQIPEWSDIVEYYGGYSGLTGSGIKKEDLERFRVTKLLKRVEIEDENRCIAIIEINGEKDYGLKFYNLDGTQKIIYGIYGIYQLDDFTITDLYYISKSILGDNIPKIEFKFIDQDLVQTKHSIFTEPGVIIKPVDKINKKIIDLSKTYFSTIEMMIDDLVPLSYYNTLNHRTQLAKEKAEEIALECEELYKEYEHLKSRVLSLIQYAMSNHYKMKYLDKESLSYVYGFGGSMNKIGKRYIKEYEKKYGVKQKKVDILSMNFFRYLYKRNEDSNYGQWSHEKFGEVGTNSYQREIELFDMISEMSNYHDLVSLLYVDGNLSTFSMWSSLPNSAVYSGMSKETKQRNIEISKLCQ